MAIVQLSVQGYCTTVCTGLLYSCLYRAIVQLYVQGYCTTVCTGLLYNCLYRAIIQLSIQGYYTTVCTGLLYNCLYRGICWKGNEFFVKLISPNISPWSVFEDFRYNGIIFKRNGSFYLICFVTCFLLDNPE